MRLCSAELSAIESNHESEAVLRNLSLSQQRISDYEKERLAVESKSCISLLIMNWDSAVSLKKKSLNHICFFFFLHMVIFTAKREKTNIK